MLKYLLAFSLLLPAAVLAQEAPRQHPALLPFDMSGLDALRQKVDAVLNRPADLSDGKVAAFEQARGAAQGGEAAAQLELAGMLHEGQGTPRDRDTSLVWLRKAADGGNGRAQAILGDALTYGQGLAVDRQQGQSWLRKAAAQDVEQAHITLALQYETIDSSPAERAHALHWLKVSAENGYIPAYNKIGYRLMMTATGEAQRQQAMERLVQVYAEGGLGQAADPARAALWRGKLSKLRQARAAGGVL